MTNYCVTKKGVACRNHPFRDGYCWLHRYQKPADRWVTVQPELWLPTADYKMWIGRMRSIEKLRR